MFLITSSMSSRGCVSPNSSLLGILNSFLRLEKRDTQKVGQREENRHVKYAVCCWRSRIKRQLESGGKDQSSIYIYIYTSHICT